MGTKPEKNINNVNDLIRKVDSFKTDKSSLDLSADEDLTIAVMNLVNIEEHMFFSGAKTGDSKYYLLLQEIRDIRKVLLKRLVKDTKGEEWCISKHLLSSSYRLIEYGTKLQSKGKSSEASDIFEKAYNLYCLFWYINSSEKFGEEDQKE